MSRSLPDGIKPEISPSINIELEYKKFRGLRIDMASKKGHQKIMFKVLTRNQMKYLELRANSRQEIFKILESNAHCRNLFENAIRNVPELHQLSTELKTIKNPKEFQLKSNEMILLLTKYGLLMPANDQEPLDVFGPNGKRAMVLDSSIPPKRIGIDVDSVEKPSLMTRLSIKISGLFN